MNPTRSQPSYQGWLFSDRAGSELVRKIQSLTMKMDNVELAVMLANWVVKKLPNGW